MIEVRKTTGESFVIAPIAGQWGMGQTTWTQYDVVEHHDGHEKLVGIYKHASSAQRKKRQIEAKHPEHVQEEMDAPECDRIFCTHKAVYQCPHCKKFMCFEHSADIFNQAIGKYERLCSECEPSEHPFNDTPFTEFETFEESMDRIKHRGKYEVKS